MQKNKEGKSLQEYSIKAAVDIIADANVTLQKLHHPKGQAEMQYRMHNLKLKLEQTGELGSFEKEKA